MRACLLCLLCLICLLACAVPLQAEGFSSRGELLVYHSDFAWDPGSHWNPQNRVVHQPGHIWLGEWRPDVAWRDDLFNITLKPRLLMEDSAQGSKHEAWLNEGWVRIQPRDGVSLQAGRETLLWGPAMFWNPSNPFFGNNGRNNPKREITGKTFLRGQWQWNGHWTIQAIAQLDNGHTGAGPDHRQAVKLDWNGSETQGALIVSRLPHAHAEFSSYAQWTASDALLLYGETAWGNRGPLALAQPASTPTGWRITRAPGQALDAVIGASWTFEAGRTFSAEYYRHGRGYGRQELRMINSMAESLAAQFDSMCGPLAQQQMGDLFNSGSSPMGRHTLGVQLREGSGKTFDWTLRYTRSLTDHTGEAVLQLKYDLSDTLQIWGQAMWQHGAESREYGRWLHSNAIVGLSWFMW